MSFNTDLEKAIDKSQRCNRNWDLSKQISDEDLRTMQVAVSKCPSKQNRVFYRVYYIQDRDIIEAIHLATDGYIYNFEENLSITNSQVLANTLFVFVRDREEAPIPRTKQEFDSGIDKGRFQRDEDRSLGIAAGYLSLTANLLGYDTGYCQCLDQKQIKKILGTDEEILLLVGVGFRDTQRSRLEHHKIPEFTFHSFDKNIKVARKAKKGIYN